MTRTASIAPPALPLQELWTTSTLVAANGNVQSGFINVAALARLLVSRTATAGAYTFEIEWSRDGAAVDIVQVVAVGNNSGQEIVVLSPFARFRVKNTDVALAFTAHRTNVFGR